ncbi:hypothetical protein D3C72_1756850 [compost metagenome]
MPLQAQRGGQLLAGPNLAQAAAADVMLERPGAQQFDANVARHHVAQREAGAHVVVDVQLDAAIQYGAVIGRGANLRDAHPEQHIARFMRVRRGGKPAGGDQSGDGGGADTPVQRKHFSSPIFP